MKRYLAPMLTVPELEAMGGDYEGVIASVKEEMLHNRFKGQKFPEPVVSFYDGKRLVLNKTMLQACIGWFGGDSDNWVDRRIYVFLRREEKVNKETGETWWKVQRQISCEDPQVRVPKQQDWAGRAPIEPVREREPGQDEIEPVTST
jgi:hypothetical protein